MHVVNKCWLGLFVSAVVAVIGVSVAWVLRTQSSDYCQVRLDDTLRRKAVHPITRLCLRRDDDRIVIDDAESIAHLNAAFRDAIYFGNLVPEGCSAYKGAADIGSSSPAEFEVQGSRKWRGFYVRYTPPDGGYMMDNHVVYLLVLPGPIPAPLQTLLSELTSSKLCR